MKREQLLIAPLLTILSLPAQAIVSMENLHTITPPKGLSGEIQGSASGTQGNTESSDYSLGGRVQYHTGDHTVFLLGSGTYGESSGLKDTENAFGHLRHIFQLNRYWAVEEFGQLEQDTFARLNFRGLLGAGLRLTPYRNDRIGIVHLGAGAFISSEEIDSTYTDAGTYDTTRANTYLIFKANLGKNATIANSTYYQPNVENTDDYRVFEQAALRVGINDSLSLQFAVEYRFDNLPPIGVEQGNLNYTTSLSYTIR